jgi:hypothetical protein
MTWRRIGVYYALCAVLGSYYFLFEQRPSSEKPIFDARPVQQSQFLPIARDQIYTLVLRRGDGVVTVGRNEQGWHVIEPSGAPITSALITSLVESLTIDREIQIVDRAPGDFAPYGLAPPDSAITIKGEKDNVVTTVFIGDRNPTATAVYARKDNSPEVVLLGFSVKYYEDLIFEAAGIRKKEGQA